MALTHMTRLLDTIKDHLIFLFCGYKYYRINGNADEDDRDASIEAFNKPESKKFVFLFSPLELEVSASVLLPSM